MNEKLTMKELPLSERPYEKCRHRGTEALSDAELLAVILRTGDASNTAVEVASELLRRYGKESGLACLMTLSAPELEALPGIGPVKSVGLLCVAELCRRISRSRKERSVEMQSPGTIADYFMEELCYLPHEEMHIAMFNTKNRLIHTQTISVGTVNASLASPREVFLSALRHQAVYLVLLHNHPSGDPRPSSEDIRITRDILAAGELLRIPLVDHIIIGDHCYCSLREEGMLHA